MVRTLIISYLNGNSPVMTQDAAIIMIQGLLDEIEYNRINEQNYTSWHNQAISNIELIFGKNSQEYSFIQNFFLLFIYPKKVQPLK